MVEPIRGRALGRPLWMLIAGGLLFVVGAIVTGIYFEQPWRRCPYDDASDACAMLPGDYNVMLMAMTATALGFVVALVGIVLQIYRVSRRH